ncbi:MAG: TlpA family protein disulfide reductase [Oligoflexia bacterium]|nr:TlpA family protein disulfide reductase [Oligoflexia bacterium]
MLPTLITLALALSSPPALAAAPVCDISYGWYLQNTGRPEQELAVALGCLDADARDGSDPSGFNAHFLLISALSLGMREGPTVVRLYRDWAQAEPDSDLARVGLALALSDANGDGGPWCDEAAAALQPLPSTPDIRARAIRVRSAIRRVCPGDPDEGLDDLREMAPTVAAARRPVLKRDLADHDVTAQDAAAVDRYLGDWPLPAWIAAALWDPDAAGEGLEDARATVLRVVDQAEKSDAPDLLDDAARALDSAGQTDRAKALRARRDELDPDAASAGMVRFNGVSWMPRQLRTDPQVWRDLARDYAKRPAPLALLSLKHLASQVPEDGPLRAEFEGDVADHLWWSLQRKASLKHSRLAWLANPTAERANLYGYDASLAGADLEPALAAVDQALANGPSWDPRGDNWVDGYQAWRDMAADDMSDLLDTRAQLLVRLDRWEEARAALRTAVLLGSPSAILHLHLGLIEAHLGDDEAALLHLTRGLALGGGNEARLRGRAKAQARNLLRTQRFSPRGLDAYVAARWPPEEAEDQPDNTPVPADATSGWRVGQSFPNLALTAQNGATSMLSDIEGLRVVDLWATWCGPCVKSLPGLSSLAADYTKRGVTVLAVSLDDKADTAFDFKDGPRSPAYQLLWAGQHAFTDAKINGIPAAFLIDEKGEIVAYTRGYSKGDHRLEDALDTLLDKQEGAL